VSDAEIVTLAVAQALLDIPADRAFSRGGAAAARAVSAVGAPGRLGQSAGSRTAHRLIDSGRQCRSRAGWQGKPSSEEGYSRHPRESPGRRQPAEVAAVSNYATARRGRA
jgi:hypothetical protein